MSTIQIIGLVVLAIVIIYSIYEQYKKRKQKENPQEQSSEQPLPKKKNNSWTYLFLVFILVAGGYYYYLQYYKVETVELPISEVVTLSQSNTFSEMELEYNGGYGTLKLVVADGLDVTTKDIEDKEVTIVGGDKLKCVVGLIEVSDLKDMGLVLPSKFSSSKTSSGFDWSQWLYLIVLVGILYWMMKGSFLVGSVGKVKKEKNTIRFSDIGGMTEAKENLREVVEFLNDRKHFDSLGAKIPKGVLLEGLPGTGKTMLARAVATEADADFYAISGSELHDKYISVAAQRIKKLFKQAKKSSKARSIIFIDEIDSVAHKRGGEGSDVSREWNHTTNQLLAEMDGFTPNTQVIVIAATNRADVLDPAILRAGRFDRKIVVPLPNLQDRAEILKIHLRGKPVSSDINIESIAKQTSGFSGADLALLLNESAILAGRGKQVAISNDNISKAMDKVIAGEERKNHKLSSEDKNLVAVHESGHALVATMLKDADKVQRISILPRGQAGGFTRTASETEHIVLTQDKAMAMISVLLAGRASEEIILNQITSGAQSDLQKANEIAKEAVEHLGMGKTFGLRYVGANSYGVKDIGTESQQIIEKDIKNILDNCYEIAKNTIKENKSKLQALVLKLIEKESVNIDEIANILR